MEKTGDADMTDLPQAPLADAPPAEDRVTVYDRDHLKLYMRLLDANAEGAPLPEIARILFGIDAEAEPERARRTKGNFGLGLSLARPRRGIRRCAERITEAPDQGRPCRSRSR